MANESILVHNINSEQFFNKLNEIKKEIKKEILENYPRPQQVEKPKEELLTIEEVAMFFKRHKDTIINWTKQGFLRKHEIGTAKYYKRSEVESAITPSR